MSSKKVNILKRETILNFVSLFKWQKDKTYTIEKYCEDMLELYDLFNMFPAEEIFGEDIVRECEQLIKEYEEKKKKK